MVVATFAIHVDAMISFESESHSLQINEIKEVWSCEIHETVTIMHAQSGQPLVLCKIARTIT